MGPVVRAIGERAKSSAILRWQRAHASDPANKWLRFGEARASARPKPLTRSAMRRSIQRLWAVSKIKACADLNNAVARKTSDLSKDGTRYTGINTAQVVPIERVQEFRPQLGVEFFFHRESLHEPHILVDYSEVAGLRVITGSSSER